MTVTDLDHRIHLAERSMRAYAMGLLGLIPVLGLPLAGLAAWIGLRVRQTTRDHWNPAARYANAAILLGSLSLALQFGVAVQQILFPDFFDWIVGV